MKYEKTCSGSMDGNESALLFNTLVGKISKGKIIFFFSNVIQSLKIDTNIIL